MEICGQREDTLDITLRTLSAVFTVIA